MNYSNYSDIINSIMSIRDSQNASLENVKKSRRAIIRNTVLISHGFVLIYFNICDSIVDSYDKPSAGTPLAYEYMDEAYNYGVSSYNQ